MKWDEMRDEKRWEEIWWGEIKWDETRCDGTKIEYKICWDDKRRANMTYCHTEKSCRDLCEIEPPAGWIHSFASSLNILNILQKNLTPATSTLPQFGVMKTSHGAMAPQWVHLPHRPGAAVHQEVAANLLGALVSCGDGEICMGSYIYIHMYISI